MLNLLEGLLGIGVFPPGALSKWSIPGLDQGSVVAIVLELCIALGSISLSLGPVDELGLSILRDSSDINSFAILLQAGELLVVPDTVLPKGREAGLAGADGLIHDVNMAGAERGHGSRHVLEVGSHLSLVGHDAAERVGGAAVGLAVILVTPHLPNGGHGWALLFGIGLRPLAETACVEKTGVGRWLLAGIGLEPLIVC